MITNATAFDFNGSGSSYIVQINPTADGAVSVSIAAEVAQDAAGNGNDASSTISVDYDDTNPTVVVLRNGTDPVEGDFDIAIEFSEDVFGFESADVLVANGTLSSFSGTGSSYTGTITPSGLLVTVDIARDLAGNHNTTAETLSVEFSTSKQTQVITVVPIDDQTYGNEPFDLIASTDSDLELSFETSGPILLEDSKVTMTGTGMASIVVSQSGNDAFQSASIEITFEISKANLSVVADDQIKVYAQEVPSLTYEISGFVYNEDLSVMSTLPSLETEAGQFSDVGEYSIVASGAEAENYTFSYIDGKLSITQATQEITVEAVSDKLVTDESFDLGATTTSNLTLTYAVTGPVSVDNGIVTLSGQSGEVNISIDQVGNINYAAAEIVNLIFQVTDPKKSDQQITLSPIEDKIYGDSFALNASASSGLEVTYSVVSRS